MKDHDPVPDTPEEVTLEIAAILVKGYLRHRKAKRRSEAAQVETPHEGGPQALPGESENSLDCSAKQSVHGEEDQRKEPT